MGVLTNDMARLRDEVLTLRGTREEMIGDLARGTRNLKKAVCGMLGAFRSSHRKMARQTRADCSAFLAGVKTTVDGLRKELTSDLRGARRAWGGSAAARRAGGRMAARRTAARGGRR
jgi:hypothetical protein